MKERVSKIQVNNAGKSTAFFKVVVLLYIVYEGFKLKCYELKSKFSFLPFLLDSNQRKELGFLK